MKVGKNKILKYFLTILVFLLPNNFSVKAQKRYACDQRNNIRFDRLTAKLITFGNSGRHFPESNEEVPKYCNDTKDLVSTYEDIKERCLKGLAKQTVSVFIYSINTGIKQLCKKSSKRLERLIASAKCSNDAKDEFDKCFAKTIDKFLGIQNAPHKDKIPMMCCQYQSLQSCIKAIAPKVSSCNPTHMQTILDFIDSVSGNALNLMCGSADGSDSCDKIKVPKKRRNQLRTKSFFSPLITLFESFPEV